MRIGLIGIGVVGGTLKRWFEENTQHELCLYDPPKNLVDSLKGCEAIFISVPVPAFKGGQDLTILKQAVLRAKQYTTNVFIRSTVLPGTNDTLGTVAMPEFLTERRAYQDFCELPILLGQFSSPELIRELFPNKEIVCMSNIEAELAKFTHNCFGAMKVTYFNVIEELCRKLDANFANVKTGAALTGFIEPTHTQVPGPDGSRGYGGKCFPENILAMKEFLSQIGMNSGSAFFSTINQLNNVYRTQFSPELFRAITPEEVLEDMA